jgi:hypothetical protein
MKNPKIFILLLFSLCFSCQELEFENSIEKNISLLPEGVIGFSQIPKSDPKVQSAIRSLTDKFPSENSRLLNSELVNVSIFQYENGLESIVFSCEDETERVFGQILDPTTGNEKEFIVADFNYEKKFNDKPTISFFSLNSDFKFIYSPFPDLDQNARINSWGSCMKDAIDKLYNDWDNDPIGTFGCWATGASCVYGGAIACGIKSFIK